MYNKQSIIFCIHLSVDDGWVELREGEDVCGGILLPPLSVHLLDVSIVAEKNCDRHLIHVIKLLPTVDRQLDDLRAVDLELLQKRLGKDNMLMSSYLDLCNNIMCT